VFELSRGGWRVCGFGGVWVGGGGASAIGEWKVVAEFADLH
jgi:hypothetical protein